MLYDTPTIAFSTGDPMHNVTSDGTPPTLTLNSGNSYWVQNDSTALVPGPLTRSMTTTSTIRSVHRGLGMHDWAANTSEDYTGSDIFAVNTLTTPAQVVSVKTTPWKVTQSNVGSDTFSVTVQYDTPMDTTSTPTLGFVGDTPALTAAANGTLEFDGGSWTSDEVYCPTTTSRIPPRKSPACTSRWRGLRTPPVTTRPGGTPWTTSSPST